MDFKKAYEALKQGADIKRPSWKGFWRKENNTIVMHCKDGKKIPITETDDVFFTFDNIAADDWEIVDGNTVKGLDITTFTFGEAISRLKRGQKVARKGWNGKGIYIEMQKPGEHSKMTLPYIYIVTNGLISNNPDAPRGVVPWLASQTDMLATDWVVVE
ncbi:MAG: DUF2829 domain-containing protein [Clostridia bacterium]|nr:DUF2829 domain-containing protein [Clostridia bacterium]